MTAFDIIVLFLLGGASILGFARGFVQEALALISWLLVIVAVRVLHGPVTGQLAEPIGTEAGAAVLAFLSIAIVTYALGRWIAKSAGRRSRKSVLGAFDRVLGFGFGAIKGLIAASLLFLLIVMGYETIFGGDSQRPEWLTTSRTYPLVNASGEAISALVAQRRAAEQEKAAQEDTEADGPIP